MIELIFDLMRDPFPGIPEWVRGLFWATLLAAAATGIWFAVSTWS